MPNHFSSIGLAVESESDMEALIHRLAPLATAVRQSSKPYWYWSSPCGAELWLQSNSANQVIGVTPAFRGQSSIQVKLTARMSRDDSGLDGGFHGWAAPDCFEGSAGAYPFVFDVPDFGNTEKVSLPSTVDLQISAFAHELRIFDSLEEYEGSQTEEVKYAAESLIPIGLFMADPNSQEPPPALVVFTGQVTASEKMINSLSGAPYYWALVKTLGGSFDVVIDPELCDSAPQSGNIVSGEFWLCGRVPAPASRGFFQRLFRR